MIQVIDLAHVLSECLKGAVNQRYSELIRVAHSVSFDPNDLLNRAIVAHYADIRLRCAAAVTRKTPLPTSSTIFM